MTKMITMGFVWGEWGKVVSAIERSKQNPLTLPSICTEPSHITLNMYRTPSHYPQSVQNPLTLSSICTEPPHIILNLYRTPSHYPQSVQNPLTLSSICTWGPYIGKLCVLQFDWFHRDWAKFDIRQSYKCKWMGLHKVQVKVTVNNYIVRCSGIVRLIINWKTQKHARTSI